MSFSNNSSLSNFFSQSNIANLLQSQKHIDNSKSSGRWSKEEHQKFVQGVTKFGKNWKKVEEYIGTRTGAQIRSHAQKFFIRLTKEYKKRAEKNEREGEKEKDREKGRGRSDSIVSTLSNNYELGKAFIFFNFFRIIFLSYLGLFFSKDFQLKRQ
jgi:SHAQKYF class myb-like DNA-binding protein